jgi:RHS repeat-associated protein
VALDGRKFDSEKYRYGFNGKEKDDEMNVEGGSYDYGMRMYDSRLARFASIDPLSSSFPWNSTYAYCENDPISAVDMDGLEKKKKVKCQMGCDDMFAKKPTGDEKPKLKQPKSQDHEDNIKYACYKVNPTLKDKDGKDKKPGQLLIVVQSDENFEDKYDPKKTQMEQNVVVQYPNTDYDPGADKNNTGDDDKRMDQIDAPVEVTIFDSRNLGHIKIILNTMDQYKYIKENFKNFEADILDALKPKLQQAHLNSENVDKTFENDMKQYDAAWKKYHRQQNKHSFLKKIGIDSKYPDKPDEKRPKRTRMVTSGLGS